MAVIDSNSRIFCRRHSTSSYPQVRSSVVGYKRSQRRVAWYTSRYPGITQKLSVVDNTLLPSQWRFRVQARIVRFDSVSTFIVPRSLSVRLWSPSWFSKSQYKFSRGKFIVYELVTMFMSLVMAPHNYLFTSNQLVTLHLVLLTVTVNDARIFAVL